MARPKKSRKISTPPKMKGFKPFGQPICKTDPVRMSFEEYESFRLINYENLQQDSAAELMEVSRPTFTRIYNRALKSIASAFAEGKAIVIAGGSYEIDDDWFKCKKCHKLIQGIENHVKCKGCPEFSPGELISLNG